MAVPTITTIAPSTGTPAGGQAVEIIGTNFRLPSAPPATGPAPVLPSPVEVLFDGVASPKVAVLTDSRLYAVTPVHSMPFNSQGVTSGTDAVNVIVRNVDDTGTPIPGETVTASNGYTYARPGITHEQSGDFVRVTMLLIDTMRSQVLANTVVETSVDFDPNTGTARIDVSTLPSLIVEGPTVTFNPFFTYRGQNPVPGQNAGEVFLQRRHRVVDLAFDLTGVTDSMVELINLIQLLEVAVDRNSNLYLPLDASDPSAGTLPLEISFTSDPVYERQEAELGSDIRVFRASILLKGYPLNTFAGVTNDDVQDFAASVSTISLADAEQTGENNPTTQGASTRSPPDTSTAPPTTPHGVTTRSPSDTSTAPPTTPHGVTTRSPADTSTAPPTTPHPGTTRSPSDTSTAPPTAPPQGAPTRSPPDQPISEPPTLPPQGVTRRSPPDAENQP